jgi:hypothetical protein
VTGVHSKVKPDPFRTPPIQMTSALAARFRTLDRLTETEQACSVCHAGRDVPKVHKRDRLICLVCNAVLGQLTPLGREKVLLLGVDRMKWSERRLPYYRTWFQHPDRATLHLTHPQLQKGAA